MGTSSFNFDLDDLADEGSFARAVGRNHVNITPIGTTAPLKTTRSVDPTPQSNMTSWAFSDILQGGASLKPTGATYDVFNQSLSNDLVGILNSEGNINELLGPRSLFAPYDVVARGQNGPVGGPNAGNSNMDGIVAGAVDPSGMGSAGTGERQAEAPKGQTITVVTVQGITVNKQISGALDKMLTAAKGAGITMGGSGWRSHQRQIELRTINGCPDVWKASPSKCRTPTAIPGTSQHEFGLAIDFTENGASLTRSTKSFNWLMANASKYGFKNLPSEPWHWSTTGK